MGAFLLRGGMHDHSSREPTVYLVEDEPALRKLLLRVFERAGIKAEAFASAEEFLAAFDPEWPGCLLLDLSLPGMSGLQLQQKLRDVHARLPVIFLTGSADVADATAGMRAGAFDLLEKPFEDGHLISRVREALDLDRRQRAERALWRQINECVESLSVREREVLDLVVSGHANKEIAKMLDASPRTIEIHRGRAMHKMQAENLPELVRVMLLWQNGSSDPSSKI